MTNTNTAVDGERRGQVLVKLSEVLSRLLVTELGHTQNVSWKAKETEVCSTERVLTSAHQISLYSQHKFW